MAGPIEDKIEERNAIAEERLQKQGFFGRILNHVGLATADGIDRVEAPFNNSMVAFESGMVGGAMRGAVVSSLIIWLPLFAFGAITAATAGPALLGIASVSALVVGTYHGVKEVKEYQKHKNDKPLSDKVAEKLGIVAEKAPERSGHDHDNGIHYRSDHAKRVKERRVAAPLQEQQL